MTYILGLMDHGWSISSREQDIEIIVPTKDIEIIVPATVIPYACGRAVRRIHLLMGRFHEYIIINRE